MNKTIDIANFLGTPNAIIHKFGMEVYSESVRYLSHGDKIILSFENVKNATTGFFNALIGNLYKDYRDKFFELVSVKGLEKNSDWVEKFEDAIELVKSPERITDIDEAIAKLFSE